MAKSDRISIQAAAKVIVEAIYTDDKERKATDRVRHRINDAVKKGRLTLDQHRNLDRREFLTWAAETWPKLRKKMLDIPWVTRPITAQIGLKGLSGDVYQASGDPNELRRLLGEERRLRRECEFRLKEAQKQLEKKKAVFAKLSAAGRRGGRGRVVEN